MTTRRIDVMSSRAELVLTAWAGVVGLSLTIVGGLMAREFDTAIGGTPSDIVEFYEETAFDTQYVTGVIVETLGFLLLMAFVLALARVVQANRDGSGWLGTVIVASVIVGTALGLLSISLHAAAIFRAANGSLANDGYVVLMDLRQTTYWVALPAWALIFLTSGGLIVRTRSFSPWQGWSAVVIGIALLVVPFIDSVDVWDAATGLGVLWWVAAAVQMLARPDRFLTLPEQQSST